VTLVDSLGEAAAAAVNASHQAKWPGLYLKVPPRPRVAKCTVIVFYRAMSDHGGRLFVKGLFVLLRQAAVGLAKLFNLLGQLVELVG